MMDIVLNAQKIREIEVPLFELEQKVMRLEAQLQTKDLDVDYLAAQFHIAGGNIINSAINACIVAASEQEPVSMKHCIVAIAGELYKMGKQINRVHFGEFYHFVDGMY